MKVVHGMATPWVLTCTAGIALIPSSTVYGCSIHGNEPDDLKDAWSNQVSTKN